MTTTFQAKLFVASLTSALIALAVAGALFAVTMRGEINAHTETTLIAQARLAADLLGRDAPARWHFPSSMPKPTTSVS